MRLPGCFLLLASLLSAGEDSFTLAGLSLTPKPWDKQANFAKLERFAREAAARGAQAIVTPEASWKVMSATSATRPI